MCVSRLGYPPKGSQQQQQQQEIQSIPTQSVHSEDTTSDSTMTRTLCRKHWCLREAPPSCLPSSPSSLPIFTLARGLEHVADTVGLEPRNHANLIGLQKSGLPGKSESMSPFSVFGAILSLQNLWYWRRRHKEVLRPNY